MTPTTADPDLTPTAHRASAPTIEDLHRLRRSGDLDRLAAVGTALHHLTSLVGLDPVTAHRATTVLTRQLHQRLTAGAVADAVTIVTDPHRAALPGGITAGELPGWWTARPLAVRRANATVDGTRTYGEDAIRGLAAGRATAAAEPWWGTAQWHDAVRARAAARTFRPHELATLRDWPDTVRVEVLEDILHG